MKLTALKKIGKTHPGQVFEIRDKEARVLIAMKLAAPYEGTGRATAVTKVMIPESAVSPEPDVVSEPPAVEETKPSAETGKNEAPSAKEKAPAARAGRTYQRRDLTATE